ncbi:MAG TPA: mannonate dehydratase, partial [Clostridiaceae bacterium]
EGSWFDKIKLGLPGREEELKDVITLIENMGKLGIGVYCYNWMPVISWFRTSDYARTRGGALSTEFNNDQMKFAPHTWAGEVSEERLWENLQWFLDRVVPVAEKAGVKLALHPDDPPVTPIRGISRILITPEAFQRAIDMYPSPNNGITLCQGSFRAQGSDVIDVINKFVPQKKVFFVHFRDVVGTKDHFHEVFHDDGPTDMYECMKVYMKLGYDGPIRPDHVPTIEGDKHDHPGYTTFGNLYAVGYMKGILEAAEKETKIK